VKMLIAEHTAMVNKINFICLHQNFRNCRSQILSLISLPESQISSKCMRGASNNYINPFQF
jgi:hypothetical protein